MKNLSLALIAISLTFLIPIGVVYSILTRGFNGLWRVCKQFALAWDRLGGVICADMFNDLMVKPHGYRYGNGEDLISYVMGRNKAIDTHYKLGVKVADAINTIDTNHVEDAVKNKTNKK